MATSGKSGRRVKNRSRKARPSSDKGSPRVDPPVQRLFDLRLAMEDAAPVYQQLVDQLRLLVSTGELAAGSRLPSARHLAANLKINRNTALKAYLVLAREGVLEGRRGGGTVVIGPAKDKRGGAMRIPLSLVEQVNRLIAASDELGVTASDLVAFVSRQTDVRRHHSDLRVGFVECNPESVSYYVGRLREEFGVTVVPALLGELKAISLGGGMRELDCIVSTFFHLSEVRRLLRDTRVESELFAIGVRPHLSVLEALERLPRRSTVGVMYYERPGDLFAAERLARMADAVGGAGVREVRVRPVLVRGALAPSHTEGLDTIVVRPENIAPIRDALPRSVPVIEFINDLDAASLQFLREVFDDIALRRARGGLAEPRVAVRAN